MVETLDLPQAVPDLAGATFLITGSGRRLREVIQDPAANLGCLVIDEGGSDRQAVHLARRLFLHLTSEFNSHLAVHYSQVMATHPTSMPSFTPAPAPDLPQPHPCLPDTLYLKPAHPALAARADCAAARKELATWLSSCRFTALNARPPLPPEEAPHRPVGQSMGDGPLGHFSSSATYRPDWNMLKTGAITSI